MEGCCSCSCKLLLTHTSLWVIEACVRTFQCDPKLSGRSLNSRGEVWLRIGSALSKGGVSFALAAGCTIQLELIFLVRIFNRPALPVPRIAAGNTQSEPPKIIAMCPEKLPELEPRRDPSGGIVASDAFRIFVS